MIKNIKIENKNLLNDIESQVKIYKSLKIKKDSSNNPEISTALINSSNKGNTDKNNISQKTIFRTIANSKINRDKFAAFTLGEYRNKYMKKIQK
jgi:hypothetical protein